jgi:hypothetical protein
MKLSVLVLHNLGDPTCWRHALVEKELCLPIHASSHNYIVHDSELPLPEIVKDIQFDAIILTQTFLSKRSDPNFFRQVRQTYEFVKHSQALKIALPQDDYTCCNILDSWMMDWDIDFVYTVCLNDWDVLYKSYYKTGRLVQGYTGYISNTHIERSINVKSVESRSIDVSYRAASLLPVFGKLGKIKTEIGYLFDKAANGSGLRLDLSTDPSDTITGKAWLDFIENSKSMLGVNSGSSILDPDGLINIAVYNYMQLNPMATFEEIESACFPGVDGKYTFTAVSPRNMECALIKTTQILTPGLYGNFIYPWKHYLPIEPDMGNVKEIIGALKDYKLLETIATECKEAFLSYPELRYENHVADLLLKIYNGTNLSDSKRESTIHLFDKVSQLKKNVEESYWHRKRFKTKYKEKLALMGARKVKYRIKYFLNKLIN